jgi:hypothetical protein
MPVDDQNRDHQVGSEITSEEVDFEYVDEEEASNRDQTDKHNIAAEKVNTADWTPKTIDATLIGDFLMFLSVQNTITVPENLSNLTSLLSKLDPNPASAPLTLILHPKTERV